MVNDQFPHQSCHNIIHEKNTPIQSHELNTGCIVNIPMMGFNGPE